MYINIQWELTMSYYFSKLSKNIRKYKLKDNFLEKY